MSNIKVTPEELRSKANQMRSKINSMRESLDKVTVNVDKTVPIFEGKGADKLRDTYNSLKPRFEDFYSAMESYAVFLDKAADSYDETDTAIQKAAEDALEI